eukprot:6952179-Pyramimonas_sp.AAC.1
MTLVFTYSRRRLFTALACRTDWPIVCFISHLTEDKGCNANWSPTLMWARLDTPGSCDNKRLAQIKVQLESTHPSHWPCFSRAVCAERLAAISS